MNILIHISACPNWRHIALSLEILTLKAGRALQCVLKYGLQSSISIVQKLKPILGTTWVLKVVPDWKNWTKISRWIDMIGAVNDLRSFHDIL